MTVFSRQASPKLLGFLGLFFTSLTNEGINMTNQCLIKHFKHLQWRTAVCEVLGASLPLTECC
jgi:hypothetical protein